ncbi:LuxR C-terminal-related transcriptional regulator [Nonomuraea mangrovi]|uniref:LuxR C-terminal-related transcriptional regulator n=1 Tax=Nonomuraea mangrovi TaxID=2316207 RepID=A0ABW4T3C4_9ACTN
MAEVIADLLIAPPGHELLELAAGAGGNPILLVELMTGLREEQTISVSGGLAHLASERLPQRLQGLVTRRLERLSSQARQLVETAAVLGQSFSPEDVAEALGRTPATLLPALDEAMDAQVLVVGSDSLRFRHDLVRKAVVEGLPPPVRQALHHQIGGLLLERGGSAVGAATHLLLGGQHGDTRTLAELDQAVNELLADAPGTAADIAVRAMELTDDDSPQHFTRTLTAAHAMTEAGQLTGATDLITRALAQPLPPPAVAQLRCALSAILLLAGQMADAVIEAEAALAEPTLPDGTRDEALATLLYALAGQQDGDCAIRQAESILAGTERRGDAVMVSALVVLSVAQWDRGRLIDGLRLARKAVQLANEGSRAARRTHPKLALASMLLDIRRLSEAETVLQAAREEAKKLGHTAWAIGPAILGARLELACHRLTDAVTRAEAGLAAADTLGTHLFTSMGMAVLGTAALRRGDLQTAAACVETDRALLPDYAATHGQMRCQVVAAQVAEALGQPRRAMALIAGLYPVLDQRRSLLVVEPTVAAWLVRLALSVDDRRRAETVVAAADRLAADNSDFPLFLAAAAHARGLLDQDVSALAVAVAHAGDDYAQASAREDLGAALALNGERDGAIRSLDDALAGYEAMGAVRDAARARRRLRRLGVRHRHWARGEGTALGWEGLTATQRLVARLVAQGLTNRQVADQMFISVHTVAFHLRQIFRKLDINSRVDLTRLTVEEAYLHPGPPGRG